MQNCWPPRKTSSKWCVEPGLPRTSSPSKRKYVLKTQKLFAFYAKIVVNNFGLDLAQLKNSLLEAPPAKTLSNCPDDSQFTDKQLSIDSIRTLVLEQWTYWTPKKASKYSKSLLFTFIFDPLRFDAKRSST